MVGEVAARERTVARGIAPSVCSAVQSLRAGVSSSGARRSLGGRPVLEQILDLFADVSFYQRPDLRIAVHSIMRFQDMAIEPWVGGAFSGQSCVVESNVRDDLRPACIQRFDLPPPLTASISAFSSADGADGRNDSCEAVSCAWQLMPRAEIAIAVILTAGRYI